MPYVHNHTYYTSLQVHLAAFVLPAFLERRLEGHAPMYPLTVGNISVASGVDTTRPPYEFQSHLYDHVPLYD